MDTLTIALAGPDLAARRAGAELRYQIERAVKSGCRVQINLQSIESISSSFADEAFGILALEYGREVFSKIAFDTKDRNLLTSVAKAIHARLVERAATQTDATAAV